MPLGFSPIAAAGMGSGSTAAPVTSVAGAASVLSVTATGAVGAVTVSAKARVFPDGVTAAGLRGDVTVSGKGNLTLSGVFATARLGSLGAVTANGGNAFFIPPGLFTMTGRVGDANIQTFVNNAAVTLTGFEGTTSVGDVTVTGGTVVSVFPVDVVGVECFGRVGEALHIQSSTVTLSGFEMRMPDPLMGHAVGSAFGTNLTNVKESSWTPISPT